MGRHRTAGAGFRFEPNSADPSRSFPRAANPPCRHRKALSRGAAMGGRLPRGFCVKRLTDLPMLWSEQWRALGLQAPIQLQAEPADRRYGYPLQSFLRAQFGSNANEGARRFHQSIARRSPLARRTPGRSHPDHRVARHPRGQKRALDPNDAVPCVHVPRSGRSRDGGSTSARALHQAPDPPADALVRAMGPAAHPHADRGAAGRESWSRKKAAPQGSAPGGPARKRAA